MAFNLVDFLIDYEAEDLIGNAKYVLICIAKHARPKGGRCVAWPSIRTIARKCGIDQVTVQKQIKHLVQHEYIFKLKETYNFSKYEINLNKIQYSVKDSVRDKEDTKCMSHSYTYVSLKGNLLNGQVYEPLIHGVGATHTSCMSYSYRISNESVNESVRESAPTENSFENSSRTKLSLVQKESNAESESTKFDHVTNLSFDQEKHTFFENPVKPITDHSLENKPIVKKRGTKPKVSKKTDKKTEEEVVPLPEWLKIPEWEDYVERRRSKHGKMDERQWNAQIKALEQIKALGENVVPWLVEAALEKWKKIQVKYVEERRARTKPVWQQNQIQPPAKKTEDEKRIADLSLLRKRLVHARGQLDETRKGDNKNPVIELKARGYEAEIREIMNEINEKGGNAEEIDPKQPLKIENNTPRLNDPVKIDSLLRGIR